MYPYTLIGISVFREKEDDKLLNKSSVSGLMGQKYGEPSGSSAQQLALGADQSTSVTSSNKDLSVTLSKADKYHKQIPVIMKIRQGFSRLPFWQFFTPKPCFGPSKVRGKSPE